MASISAFAQSVGGDYSITQYTVDNGGGVSRSGSTELRGTIAQADAAIIGSTGGKFSLSGGFWARGSLLGPSELLFADGFENRQALASPFPSHRLQ